MAGVAKADECEVMGSEYEAVLGACSAFWLGQEGRGCLHHCAAVFADQVGVVVGGQVVYGSAVAEVGVFDGTGALKDFHRSVDGGAVDSGHGVMHPVDELVCGQMAFGLEQNFDDRSSCRCDALAFGTKASKDRLHTIGHSSQG